MQQIKKTTAGYDLCQEHSRARQMELKMLLVVRCRVPDTARQEAAAWRGHAPSRWYSALACGKALGDAGTFSLSKWKFSNYKEMMRGDANLISWTKGCKLCSSHFGGGGISLEFSWFKHCRSQHGLSFVRKPRPSHSGPYFVESRVPVGSSSQGLLLLSQCSTPEF